MKELLLGTAAVVALLAAQPSRAADLSISPHPPKSLTAAATNWTGCYAGAQAGGGVTSDSFNSFSGGGGLIGGQLGCNYQTGAIVWGIEGEAAWSSLANRDSSTTLTLPVSSFVTTDRNRWSADLAARAGVAIDRALIYGKAGIATGGFSSALSDTTPGDFKNGSGTLTGLLLGFGVEYAFAPNWSARLEYDHIDYLGTLHFNESASLGGPADQSISSQTNIVKAGINYRFGGSDLTFMTDVPAWPPIAKAPVYKAPATAAYDWTGCYAGASAGAGLLSDSVFGVNGANGLAGGQLGCNLQTGQIVWGVEGEAASGLRNRVDFSQAGSSSDTVIGRNRWSADLAARAGIAIDRALIYGKAGIATGGIAIAENFSGGFQNASGTLTGVVFGAGIEVALAPHWSARLEFDHFDYLGKTLHFNADGVVFAPRDLTVSAQANLVKAGVNYQLNGSDRPFAAASARPALPAATYNWSGCYAGVHGGGGVLSDPFVNFGGGAPVNGGGGIAGGQAGCDIQRGQIVWGVEGEAAWSGLKNNFVVNQPTTAAFGAGQSQQSTSANRWSADVAIRAGVAIGRALIYGKAGVASGRFDFAENLAVNDGSSSNFQNGSATLTGLVFGAGLEYAFAANWSAKFEFDRIDYLSPNVQFARGDTNGGVAFSTPFSHTETATANVAKVGVNYRFFGGGEATVAKY